ncbi:hypothetical protein [Rhizobium sp. L9]|uniref:hypothetical protein n=1 Tax=Rhizobium sp. L9 TaxID=1340738 RepID=UPI001596C864|nr:hypothetical protein [Rhizobium sp. L9]
MMAAIELWLRHEATTYGVIFPAGCVNNAAQIRGGKYPRRRIDDEVRQHGAKHSHKKLMNLVDYTTPIPSLVLDLDSARSVAGKQTYDLSPASR